VDRHGLGSLTTLFFSVSKAAAMRAESQPAFAAQQIQRQVERGARPARRPWL